MEENKTNENKIIKNITISNLILNVVIFTSLLTLGIIAKSRTVVFASIDTILDIIVSIVLWIFAIVATKKEDANHPYGHERFESISVIIMAVILIVTASNLIFNGGENLYLVLSKKDNSFNNPGMLANVAILIKLVIKIVIFSVTLTYYKKVKFISLKAIFTDAIIDVVANVLAIISVLLAYFKLTYFEPIGSIIIALFILFNGVSLLKNTVSQVVDKSLDETTTKHLKEIILSVDGVERIDLLKSRQFGIKLYIDIEISIDGSLTVSDSHEIAETVHKKIKNYYKEVKYCMVHINPFIKGEDDGKKDSSY